MKREGSKNKEEERILRIAEAERFEFADVDHLGSYHEDNAQSKHIDSVLWQKLS